MSITSNNLSWLGSILAAIVGFFLRVIYDNIKKYLGNRLKIMNCYFLENKYIPEAPFKTKPFRYIFFKQFRLHNSTSMYIDRFKIVFYFGVNATVINKNNHCKAGTDLYRFELSKPNEVVCIIEKFNIEDEIVFEFKVEELNEIHEYSVNEHESKGFLIKVIDIRKPLKPIPSKKVSRIEIVNIHK